MRRSTASPLRAMQAALAQGLTAEYELPQELPPTMIALLMQIK
jgi:hypothetical protein